MRSFQHGDLHTGNLILPLEPPEDREDFWLIDFDRAGDGYFGQDIAYLELSIICDFYDQLTSPSLATCLSGAEFPERRHPVPDDLQWLAGFMRNTRAAIAEFGAGTAGRADDLERQMVIARIAEGLRWARRHRGRRKSKLALYYAGWYVTHLERLGGDPPVLAGTGGRGGGDGGGPADEPLEGAGLKAWEGLWADAGHFARPDWTYLLVSERLGDDNSLGALGNLPFSAIVDLDPNSDNDGLHSRAGPVLASSRAVHVFSEDRPVSDDKRGTAWLMSAGWPLRREPAVNFRTWFRTKLRNVRGLFEEVRHRTGDGHVFVLALAGQHDADDAAGDADRLVRVLEAADEVWEGRATLHVVSDATVRRTVPFKHHPIAAGSFVRQLANVYGAEEAATQYRLPSADNGTVAVELDTLQVMREYFEVLHDRIAAGGGEEEQENDAFWRGGQILWSDLAEELDVPRDVGPDVTRDVLESLEKHRTHTVVLHHRPGAGGTTAALRAAWDVHRLFPVAVLRPGHALDGKRVRSLAERLHRLFVLTERPVLLVAEAADLPEANRELLYRELASRRARITLLYVRRSVSPTSEALAVTDPLSDEEAAHFLSRFRQLTKDHARIADLEMLSTPPNKRYRIPFFYGLTTFQRDFTKVGDYVSHYLRGVAGRARDVLAHLAFVTLYSNSGLQLGLIQQLFRFDSSSDQLSVEDLLGPAASLVVHRSGRYSIAHPLLAEELLAHLSESEDWRKEHLKDIALDFIEDVAAVGDTTGEPVRTLFRQIFIDRGASAGIEDRRIFAPVINDLDSMRSDNSIGHAVLEELTRAMPDESHFWNHLGRHQIYRLQRDYDVAERNLGQAISLSPNDSLHHHTLGLVRRERLKEGLDTARGQGTEAIMAVIESGFERTAECFAKSRSLTPDDIYGYVTHVQTILIAAKALQKAASVESIASLPAGASEWAMEQITIANTLLEDASKLYEPLDRQDEYLQRCEADIQHLYGNLEEVIRLWQRSYDSGRATPFSRRALAQVYLVRAKRSWRGLTETELRNIASLAEENLGRSTTRDEDYRLWFEARKLLPDFDLGKALANLEVWSARMPSWRAAYCRYVLYFLLWLLERSEDVRAFQDAQKDCMELLPGRVDHSHIWLAKDPSWCPLVADSDLGEWDRRQRFWSDPTMLRRVNGVVDFVDGFSSGQVLIGDSRVQAFFVPGVGGFMANADENVPVNFFIGFRPSGLHAWDVCRGHVEDAITRGGEPLAMPTLVSRPRASNYEEIQRERAESLGITRVRELVQSFAEAALERSGAVDLGWIQERVLTVVGLGSSDLVSEEAVRRMVMVLDGVQIEEREKGAVAVRGGRPAPAQDGDGREVGFVSHYDAMRGLGTITRHQGDALRFSISDLHPESPTEVARGAVVRFLPSRDRRIEQALEVEVLPDVSLFEGRIVRSEKLNGLVQAEISRVLEELSAKQGRGSIKADRIEDHLKRTFRGLPALDRRLGVNEGLRAFLREQQWLVVRGQRGDQIVELGEALGRGHEPSKEREQGGGDADVRVAVGTTIEELQRSRERVTLQVLGPALKQRLGTAQYKKFVGTKRLKRALEDLGECSVVAAGPGTFEVRPIGSSEGAAVASTEPTDGDTGPDVPEVVRANVTRIKGERDEVTLQALGIALREALGSAAYDKFVGTERLRRTLEDLGEWKLVEVRPGVVVVEPPSSVDATLKSSETAPNPDYVGQLVTEFRQGLIARGKKPTPQAIGSHLRNTLGEDAYRALIDKEGLRRTLERLGLWEDDGD